MAADLRVGADAAGIIVTGAGDQSRTEELEKAERTTSARFVDRRPASGRTAGGGPVRRQVGILQQLAERRLDVRAGIDKVEYGVLDRGALWGEIIVRCRLELALSGFSHDE